MIILTRNDFEIANFEYLINILLDDSNIIHTYEDIENYARHLLDRGDIWSAIHVLTELAYHPGYYYEYDFSTGSCGSLTLLQNKEDLEEYFCIIENENLEDTTR